jgi:hypothetical protein
MSTRAVTVIYQSGVRLHNCTFTRLAPNTKVKKGRQSGFKPKTRGRPAIEPTLPKVAK